MAEIRVVVEPSLPPIEVSVTPQLPSVNVNVEPAVEVKVEVEAPLPGVDVDLWPVALAGKPGKDGRDGIDGNDGGATAVALAAHIDSPNPHPAYDDGPSFLLLYENAKV